MTNTSSRLLIAVLSILQLAGCAQLSRTAKQEVGPATHTLKSSAQADYQLNSVEEKILTFVASANKGERKRFRNEKGTVSYLVSVGDSYHAASGRYCRRFTKLTQEKTTKKSYCLMHIACEDSEGRWYQVRQIINTEWPEKDIAKCSNQHDSRK